MSDQPFNSEEPTKPEREARKPRADKVAFNDEPEPEVDPDGIDPEEFDLTEWLTGIGPLRVAYPLAGGRKIQMQSRTSSFLKELAASDDFPQGDDDDAKAAKDRAFLAAHVVGDINPDVLVALQKHRPMDFQEAVDLAIAIDSKPSNQINPRFLRGASD